MIVTARPRATSPMSGNPSSTEKNAASPRNVSVVAEM